jgi:flavodoxin
MFMKTLITYFSAQGTTAKVAKALATMIDADLFEIIQNH